MALASSFRRTFYSVSLFLIQLTIVFFLLTSAKFKSCFGFAFGSASVLNNETRIILIAILSHIRKRDKLIPVVLCVYCHIKPSSMNRILLYCHNQCTGYSGSCLGKRHPCASHPSDSPSVSRSAKANSGCRAEVSPRFTNGLLQNSVPECLTPWYRFLRKSSEVLPPTSSCKTCRKNPSWQQGHQQKDSV